MACPPLVFLGALGVGLFLHWLMPVRPFPLILSQPLGGAFCLASIAVGIWGSVTMRRAGTNVRPDRPVTALVTGGPFRFSRNRSTCRSPCFTWVSPCSLTRCGRWQHSVPVLAVVHWRIVLREEQYLEAKFGDEYRAYKTRVRRWL